MFLFSCFKPRFPSEYGSLSSIVQSEIHNHIHVATLVQIVVQYLELKPIMGQLQKTLDCFSPDGVKLYPRIYMDLPTGFFLSTRDGKAYHVQLHETNKLIIKPIRHDIHIIDAAVHRSTLFLTSLGDHVHKYEVEDEVWTDLKVRGSSVSVWEDMLFVWNGSETIQMDAITCTFARAIRHQLRSFMRIETVKIHVVNDLVFALNVDTSKLYGMDIKTGETKLCIYVDFQPEDYVVVGKEVYVTRKCEKDKGRVECYSSESGKWICSWKSRYAAGVSIGKNGLLAVCNEDESAIHFFS